MSTERAVWERVDHVVEVFTNIDGDSMLFVKWSDKLTLLSKNVQMTLPQAEARAEVLNTRKGLNVGVEFVQCFPDSKDKEYYPCGGSIENWKERKGIA